MGNCVRAAQMHTEMRPAREAVPLFTMWEILLWPPNLLSKVMMMWRWLLVWVLW